MALAAGNKVFLSLYGLPSGLMSDPPLLGVVDKIDGSAPDLVRICWENGATQFFQSTNEVTVGLSIVTAISAAAAGETVNAFGLSGVEMFRVTVAAVVYRLARFTDAAGNVRYALVAV